MSLIVNLLISALAVYFTAWLLPGITVKSYGAAVGVALVIAVLNVLVKPLLVLLTIPVTALTLGLFLLVIDAIIVLLAGKLLSGFQVGGFWWALLFSVIVSVVTNLLYNLF
ncbi:MAG: phage holin family protein [Paludibacteraceae bacterium]|jgi:putative membrane protein|nr:phage holin family protein [Paludibacteraceae bacterium]